MIQGAWLLLRLFLDVALGRRGPQDVPPSQALLFVCVLVYLLSSGLLTAVGESARVAGIVAVADTLLLPLFVVPVLWLRGTARRWLQTLTALTGVGALFSLAAIIPFAVIHGDQGSPLAAAAMLALLALFIWNVLAMGNILRHAMSVAFPAGVITAMAYVAVNAMVMTQLVPEAAA